MQNLIKPTAFKFSLAQSQPVSFQFRNKTDEYGILPGSLASKDLKYTLINSYKIHKNNEEDSSSSDSQDNLSTCSLKPHPSESLNRVFNGSFILILKRPHSLKML